ncbi:Tad domain-containing protein [Burkholderia orbicola]|uniref:Tad domain-containing protein n=1 Tax=Burkholderia orbicola TaxID=2978683 RepID=A0ABT8P306_9BURK|nr:Tad domain-containing protein [Burkholderia orbicola]MDN7528231.1 Tad domain-containing protein [Burkholderia orbicola]
MVSSVSAGRAAPARERGQALVPALLFLVVGGVALYLAFNSLQLTSAKIKLQNTVDASAYAAALLQARDYNFSAYTNRAMVANQAAIAQMVSLKSFVDMLDEHVAPGSRSDQLIDRYSGGAYDWRTKKEQARAMIHPVRQRLDTDLPGMARSLDAIVVALSGAQRAYHEATLVGVPKLAGEIARANEPNTRITDGTFDDPLSRTEFAAWRTYSTTFDPRAGTDDRFADVVVDGGTLGDFARRRPVVESEARFAPGCWGSVSRYSRMNGGTQLRPDRRGWQAIDGAMTSVWTEHDCIEIHWIWVWVEDPPPESEEGEVGEEGEKGEGEVPARTGHWEAREVKVITAGINDGSAEGSGGAGNGNVMSYQNWRGYGGYVNFGYPSGSAGWVSSAMQSQYRSGPGGTMSVSGGLQPYRDLTGQSADNASPRITIRVERAQDTTISDSRLLGGGRLALSHAARPLMAVASGQTYFVRPDEKQLRYVHGLLRYASNWSRNDRRTEYPSLFSPFWEARLAPVPDQGRATAGGGVR